MSRFKMRVAVHLILKLGDEILLLRRYNTGYEDGNYSVIAGHVDGNETIISAMKREQVMHRKAEDESIDYFIYCDKYTGDISIGEPNKCDELSFYKINKLPENTIPYIKKAIENYENGVEFSNFGFAN